jgi:EAL domain-containing protein (putative c-di-GMP-specific phosphodiesterase class I)
MATGDLRFLVAEDHDFQRRAVVRMLTGLGAAEVFEAADGQSALDIIRDPNRAIDILVSDLDMPGMDGMELIRHIGDAGVKVSMILSSALDRALLLSVETMTKAYGIDLLGAIEKPVTVSKLEGLIGLYQPPSAPRQRAASPVFSLEEMRQGLANNEFEAFFQPKVAIATGEIVGAEALARWRHPAHGVIGPYSFIAVMEESGLIDELSWVMLQQSARQSRLWAEAGHDIKISVNLSLKSLTNVDLADHVVRLVQAEGADPHRLVIEVTETIAMGDIARPLENLARLRMRGFGLSIDDYGTGYSSMQQLSRIAFTELKVDQSFVMSAPDVDASRIILASSIDIARKMGLQSVAEGVETKAHWDLLSALGCDVAQGYLLARPLSAADFTRWMETYLPPG